MMFNVFLCLAILFTSLVVGGYWGARITRAFLLANTRLCELERDEDICDACDMATDSIL